jgi:hypothetical protein
VDLYCRTVGYDLTNTVDITGAIKPTLVLNTIKTALLILSNILTTLWITIAITIIIIIIIIIVTL